tara:strand:+ start:1637 stop:3190 length:1554 start_codon:yes stop_codon:yes gene_type:complete
MVIHTLGQEIVNSEISCIATNLDGSYIAWATKDGLLKIKNIEKSEIKKIQLKSYVKQINSISDGNFIIGQYEGNIICFSKNCENIWELNSPGGCELIECTEMGDLIVIIDGTNSLRTISSKGKVIGNFSKHELIGMSVNKVGSAISCWDDEGNLFVLDRYCNLIFERKSDYDLGERIICAEFTENGILVVSRESLEIPETGEQNELEFWNPLGQRIYNLGLNSKCITLSSSQNNVFAGLFNGEIYFIENFKSTMVWKNDFSISKIIPIDDEILVSSWFYLYKINVTDREESWRVEHEGVVDHLELSSNKKILILAGNDRNDYTNPSPLVLIDPNSEPYWEEEEGDEIPEDVNNLKQEVDIYDNSNNDLIDILGEEFEKYKDLKNNDNNAEINDLMITFEEKTPTKNKKNHNSEKSTLIEHLLSNEENTAQSPICNAGEDQSLDADADGTCIVILDGSSSYDPNGFIQLWNWSDENGISLANEPKIKLRLPRGIHMFTLEITDNEGSISTDSIIIKII